MASAFESDTNLQAFLRDEGFLIRCASTYNWDLLIERLAVIEGIFSSSVRQRDEPLHRMRIGAATGQLLASDDWNNRVLHIACFHNPPTQAILSLLDAASAADPPIPLTGFLTGDNSTPLIIACATGASSDIIRLLLNPPGNLIAGGIYAGFPDNQGGTPLSELCNRYEQRRKQPRYEGIAPSLEEANLVDDGLRDGYSQLFAEFWSSVEAIIRAGWHAETDSSNDRTRPLRETYTSILHGAAYMAESCPKELTHLICRCYPHMSASSDRRGVFPLHLAVCADPRRSLHIKLVQRRADMIECLLDLYPAAARRAIPGSQRLPFFEAIASGLSWHLGSEEGPLLKIWRCAPETLHSRDTETGLHPFLLAATIITNNDSEDASGLNNVYCILRLYPQVIQDMVLAT